MKETQVGYSTPEILTMLTISDITQEDFTTYRCNASIDNDKTREKSLAVELNGEGRRRNIAACIGRHRKTQGAMEIHRDT